MIKALIIGALSGYLASRIMETKKSFFTYILLGFFGGFVGHWIFDFFHLSIINSTITDILASISGAIVLIFLGRKIFD
jgi:uncharacterized membrane protein YeaQ/YmgE (transglycosylase-associated protein family)